MAGNNIVLDAVVGDIVERVVSLAVDEIGLVIGVENEVRKLKAVLTNIQAVLQDAERKQGEQQQQTLRVWLHDLKQVAYDAEDVLDKIAYKELKYTVHYKVPRWLNPKRLVSRGKIAHEIKAINQELDVIDKRRKMFQLESNNDHSASSAYFDRETASYVKDSSVIGRESDKEEIIKMLINGEGSSSNTDHDQVSIGNNSALPVISIVGLGGLGKTTLAQLVYNDAVVEEHFELRVWICVSTNFRTTNLFFQILQQINRGNTVSESSSKQVLLDELKSQLQQQGTKKFLLVLDDDWNEDQKKWEEFALPLGDFVVAGSKIIITSRDQTVASVRGSRLHLLEGLSEDSCWDLIESQAFKHGGPQKTSELVKIGNKISEKCKGVPLVAKVLGGLLHSKKTEEEWLAVQNAKFWDFNSNNTNPIMEVLKLSYNNLPLALKPCFSYCAIFPKDYWISKALLIELWMAQGLLGASDTQGEIMEDRGNTYFNILYSKSFFQEAELNECGEVIRCKMHDLLNDLAQSICKFEYQNFEENEKMNVDLSKCRHVSFISPARIETLCKAKKVRTIFGWESDSLRKAKKVRTIFVWESDSDEEKFDDGGVVEVTKINTFFKFTLLRVLDLSGFSGSNFSSLLGKLKHLRYLDLSSTSIKSLPKWVTRLYHLQTLKLIDCNELKELPEDLTNLKKLRHLFIDNGKKWKKMPQAMGKLDELRTLSVFVACKKNGISELKSLKHLQGTVLEICHLGRVKKTSLAEGAKLIIDRGDLRELSLHWDSDDGQSCVGDSQVLKELQPHRNLKELSIKGFGGVEFPGWVSNGSLLPNLVSLEIISCHRCEHIPSFGELPSLERLEIRYMRNVKSTGSSKDDGIGMGMDAGTYGSLKKLRLEGMESLEEWSEKEAGILFPCLEKLEIWHFPNLRKAPHLFPSLKSLELWNVGGVGVVSITTSLTSLTSLEITYCKDLEFLPEGLLRNNKQLDKVWVRKCPKLLRFREEEGLLLTNDDEMMVANSSSLLRVLMIWECDALKSIPDVRGFTSLERLEIKWCSELETIPKGFLSSLVALERLEVKCCDRLKGTIELSPPSLKHLQVLDFRRCPNFEGFDISSSSSSSNTEQQQQLVLFPCFHELNISGCHAISSIDVGSFASLRELDITECRGIQALQGFPFLTNLKTLQIGEFSSALRYFPFLGEDDDDDNAVQFNNLFPSLRKLWLHGWDTLQSLPHCLQHFTMLSSLNICTFPNLTALPEWLGNLASLTELKIFWCESLTHLPSKEQMQRLTFLKELYIRECPHLKERCRRDGPEWPKISHIPNLVIEDKLEDI